MKDAAGPINGVTALLASDPVALTRKSPGYLPRLQVPVAAAGEALDGHVAPLALVLATGPVSPPLGSLAGARQSALLLGRVWGSYLRRPFV